MMNVKSLDMVGWLSTAADLKDLKVSCFCPSLETGSRLGKLDAIMQNVNAMELHGLFIVVDFCDV